MQILFDGNPESTSSFRRAPQVPTSVDDFARPHLLCGRLSLGYNVYNLKISTYQGYFEDLGHSRECPTSTCFNCLAQCLSSAGPFFAAVRILARARIPTRSHGCRCALRKFCYVFPASTKSRRLFSVAGSSNVSSSFFTSCNKFDLI